MQYRERKRYVYHCKFVFRRSFNSQTRKPSITVVWTGQARTNEVVSVLAKPGSFPMKITISKPQPVYNWR